MDEAKAAAKRLSNLLFQSMEEVREFANLPPTDRGFFSDLFAQEAADIARLIIAIEGMP